MWGFPTIVSALPHLARQSVACSLQCPLRVFKSRPTVGSKSHSVLRLLCENNIPSGLSSYLAKSYGWNFISRDEKATSYKTDFAALPRTTRIIVVPRHWA